MPRTCDRWLDISDPSWLRLGKRGGSAFLIVGCVLIGSWQLSYANDPGKIDRTYRKAPGMRGAYRRSLPRFFYFFYYTGKFPITMQAQNGVLRDDEWTARRFLSIANPYLRNEDYATIRTGDLGKIFLLYPDLLRVDSPQKATLWTFNRILGIGSLLCLFCSLSLVHHRMLAVLLVLLFGSNPFQLYHLYMPPANIWAYPMCVANLVLAINAPLLLARKPNRWAFLLPLLTGAFLASVREVRTEPALIGASLLVAYAIAPRIRWSARVGLLSLFVVGALACSLVWGHYWSAKFREATEIVRRAGGKPFPELSNMHHALWHPIWWGLGDLGTDKGYRSSDRAAYAYAIPIVNKRFGAKYERQPRSYLLENVHADGSGYRIKPETLPEYTAVLRDKILADVTSDPGWYLRILAERTKRAFRGATPIRFAFGDVTLDVPFSAWLALPILGIALAARRWREAALLLFYTPTSLPTILISSRPGFDNIAAFHIAAFAVVCCWGVRAAGRLGSRRHWKATR